MMMRVKVYLETELLKDVFVIPQVTISTKVSSILEEVMKRYQMWHSFQVYQFRMKKFAHSEEGKTGGGGGGGCVFDAIFASLYHF